MDSFAASAARLAGLTTRQLGWSPDQFWQTTPAELSAIFTSDPDAPPAPLGRSELAAMLENENNG